MNLVTVSLVLLFSKMSTLAENVGNIIGANLMSPKLNEHPGRRVGGGEG